METLKYMKYTIFLTILNLTSGFYTRHHPNARTHQTITEVAALQALPTYILKYKLQGVGSEIFAIEEFFKKDTNGKTEMKKAIFAVIQSVRDTQVEKQNIAYVHCHADQIELAHNHVISCREKMKALKTDVYALRRQLGECLYTVQSFYSNTNWVEMYGKSYYSDFGVKGKKLMAVASPTENTCRDTKSIVYNCTDNIIVNGKLTSGYHHGRGNIKPTKPQGSKFGKCSHGGPEDESRKIVARCGINKDTTEERLSPHYHLHWNAYFAALEATKLFLIDEGTGILNDLGKDVFDNLFHIKTRKDISLAFVVDYSGSMSEDIAAVREYIKQLVTSTIGSENEPAEYILSLFNDPVTLNEVFTFRNGYDIINKVESVKVDGGGDCPEYAAAGIIKAIELSRKQSTLLVFTDADAKDQDRQTEVQNAAMEKQITITTFVTGRCSRKKRSHDIKRRQTGDFFLTLALATGGKVHETTKENIQTVLNEVMREIFPTAEVVLDSFTWKTASGNKKSFVVDTTVTVLKVAVHGPTNDDDFSIYYPDGTTVTEGGTVLKIITKTKEIIMSLQNPAPGEYVIHRKNSAEWKVNITAQSPINIDSEVMDPENNGGVRGEPIVGKNYTYIVNVFNLDENGTCDVAIVTDLEGNILLDNPVTQLTTLMATRCLTEFETPNKAFQLILNGTDGTGRVYSRKLFTVFKPTNVQLHVLSPDVAVVGKDLIVNYKVSNTGTYNGTYKVKITDDQSFSLMPDTRSHTLTAGESVNSSFILRPTTTSILVKFVVTVSLESTEETIQRIARTISVSQIERPTCSILKLNGTCDEIFVNTWDCVASQWTSELEIDFSGTGLESIASDVGTAVDIHHPNITEFTNGPMGINVSGTCCTPSTTINVIDTDGYISQCHIDFSGGKALASMDPADAIKNKPLPSDSNKTDGNGEHIIIIAVVSVLVIIALLTIIGYIVYKKRFINYNVAKTATTAKAEKEQSSDLQVSYHPVKSKDENDEMEPL